MTEWLKKKSNLLFYFDDTSEIFPINQLQAGLSDILLCW